MKTKDTVTTVMTQKQIIDTLLKSINWLELLKVSSGRDHAAALIGKTRRTIDAYVAPSEARTISALDLQTICFDVCKRMALVHQRPLMAYTVYDTYGQQCATSKTLSGAAFLADLEDGCFEVTRGVWQWPGDRDPHPDMTLRSQLRRIMLSGLVLQEQACRVLGCCPYSLVMLQLESPFEPRMPDAFGIRYLQSLVSEQRGEAA